MAECQVLVVGCGSELRGDDAVGRRVAEAVAARDLPGVEVRSVTQLVPELAADMGGRRLVVFVDARIGDGSDIRVAPLAEVTRHGTVSHGTDPGALLAMARLLDIEVGEVISITIPARQLGLGAPLSAAAAVDVDDAVELITAMTAALAGSTAAPN